MKLLSRNQEAQHASPVRFLVTLGGGVVIAIAFLLWWVEHERVALVVQADAEQIRAEALSLRSLISRSMTQQSALLALIAADRRDEIQHLVDNPFDWRARDDFFQHIQRVFPEVFTFTLADESGSPKLEDFDGLIGDVCRARIHEFSKKDPLTESAMVSEIHPTPHAYHIDLMTHWTLANGRRGIFFISVPPTAIAELLAASETSGRRYILALTDDPNLIEITSSGARDKLQRPFRLTDDERKEWSLSLPVPNSRWTLLARPNYSWLAEEKRRMRHQTFAIFAAFMVGSLGIMLVGMRAERKRQSNFNQRLAMRESLLSAIVDTMVDGLITIDEQGRIIGMNIAAERLFGYAETECLGRNVNMLMPEPYHSQHDNYLRNYFRSGDSKIIGTAREVAGRRADGSTFPMALSVGELYEQDSRMFVGIVHDISDFVAARQKIERQAADLERSNQDLERFAFVASHDLQEPLRKVSSFGQLLELEYADKVQGDGSMYITYMVDAAKRMGELIEGLLEYSRVTTRGRPFEQVALKGLIDEILSDLSFSIQENGAAITVDVNDSVFADATQIRQLLQNLISNALKFRRTDRECKIAIRSKSSTDATGQRFVEVRVEDNGIGIDSADYNEVFEPFRRLHTREQFPGTGLGLAICKRIAERHAGSLSVESSPGEGSRFSLRLPAVRADS